MIYNKMAKPFNRVIRDKSHTSIILYDYVCDLFFSRCSLNEASFIQGD